MTIKPDNPHVNLLVQNLRDSIGGLKPETEEKDLEIRNPWRREFYNEESVNPWKKESGPSRNWKKH